MSSIAMSALRARGALFAGAKISSRANKVGTTGPRAAVPRVTAAASGDDEYAAQLSRALRTINTASVPVKTVKTAAPVAEAKRAAATEAASVGTADEIVYTLKGPEPQKFGVADGELTNVLTASGSFVTRAVSGALCEGWTPTVVEGSPPEGQYTLG